MFIFYLRPERFRFKVQLLKGHVNGKIEPYKF